MSVGAKEYKIGSQAQNDLLKLSLRSFLDFLAKDRSNIDHSFKFVFIGFPNSFPFRQRNLKFGQTTSVQRFIPLRCDFQIVRSRNLNCLWRFSCPSLILAFQKYRNAHTQDFHGLLHADCTSIGRGMLIIKGSGNRSKRS